MESIDTKIIAVSTFKSTDNIGDIRSSPLHYFDYPNTEHWESKVATHGALPTRAAAYIFGGGAITGRVTSIVSNGQLDGPKIAWGLGRSKKAGEKYCRSTPLTDFDRDRTFFTLVGTRDVNIKGAEWVPCASCMSPLFDQDYEIEHEVAYYLNSRKPPEMDVPVMTNRYQFEDAIRFLGSAATILTDSYHGAYWATLLGRNAVITRPYSSKLRQYKHQPIILEERAYGDSEYRVFPEALAECREANVQFDAKVREVIGL
jgi:hypothetical protein